MDERRDITQEVDEQDQIEGAGADQIGADEHWHPRVFWLVPIAVMRQFADASEAAFLSENSNGKLMERGVKEWSSIAPALRLGLPCAKASLTSYSTRRAF